MIKLRLRTRNSKIFYIYFFNIPLRGVGFLKTGPSSRYSQRPDANRYPRC